MRFPVDTGRKLNVYKTFRRRPRRLVRLCMGSTNWDEGLLEKYMRPWKKMVSTS